MAKKKDKKADVEPEEGEETGGGSKLKPAIIGVVLLLVGVVLGGKVMGGGGAPESALGVTTTTTEPKGPVTSLEAINMNLADGRFLKVGIAIEVRKGEKYPDLGGAEPNEDDPTQGFARELDAAITILGSYSFPDLVSPEGRMAAKTRLLAEMQVISDDAVKDIFFHVFVMQ